jgi:lipopolysaccharide transport system ATP-binding protein
MKPILEIQDITKKFAINSEQQPYLSLRDTLSNIFKSKRTTEDFWALNNVSFNVEHGDTIGIIGKNGAGKSTLLKILSKITPPTSGKIICRGRIASLLEVGTGFHPELSGRENVFMNGSILGMRRVEIIKNFDAIVDFAGVEKFIDTPLKHYSSGMQLRLAFAVAAFLENEILIVDEILAVGDAEFQKKCMGKMGDISQSGRTVLFVSHHLGSIRQLCNKGILLESGKLKMTGTIDEVIKEYQKISEKSMKYFIEKSTKDYYISEAYIDSEVNEFYNTDRVIFVFVVSTSLIFQDNKFILIRFVDEMNQVVASSETKLIDGKKNYNFSLPENILVKGRYKLNCIIYQPAVTQYDNIQECCHFEILDNNKQFSHLETFDIGKVYIPQNWK